jgi:hypothetical protein
MKKGGAIMASLIFKDSEAARDAIMDSQKKEIAALYESWADEIGERAKFYSHKSTASAPVSERYYKELKKQLRATSQEVSNEVYSKIKKNMYTVADAVVADNVKWLQSFGFSSDGLNAAFSYVPDKIVRNLITGQIYDSGWSLSKAIWSDNEKALKDIYQVMAKGLAENKPIYEIAKELEAYVNPSKRLPWNLKAADGVKIYKKQVDYNAQRLARTLVQHGYQQSFIATTQKNPFITEYIWNSNGSRVCQLCLARDGMHFKKDELPMDHPNGMCTMIPIVADDMVDQLADWFNSPDGTYPEIDAFAGNFGYEASKTGTVKDFIDKYGTSTKSPNAWFNSLTPVQKAEAKLLKEQSGLTWNKWYEQNVYAGDGSNLGGAKTQTVKAFNDAQNKYLSPYGFTPDNMPTKFDDWSYKISHSQATEILKSMGTDWGDPHPYQQLMKYYNANLTSANLTSQTVKVTKATAKVGKSADATFDAAKWYESVKKNDLTEMEKWTDDWLKGITSEQREAVRIYTGSAYDNMNEYLRGLRKNTYYQKEIEACKEALAKASLPQDTVVRRGSGYNMLSELGLGNITPQNKDRVIGAIVQDKGFTSTSPSSTGGFSDSIEYVIKVPQGSQAMYIAPISKFHSEKELLINCGSKYVVEDVEFNSYGDVNKIYMTLKNLKNN